MDENKLTMQAGVCEFCGQQSVIEVDERLDQEEVDALVTRRCTCPGAIESVKKADKMAAAHANVEELFGRDDASYWLQEAVALIGDGWINSVTVDFGNGQKAKIKTTSKGAIIVQKIVVSQESMEA